MNAKKRTRTIMITFRDEEKWKGSSGDWGGKSTQITIRSWHSGGQGPDWEVSGTAFWREKRWTDPKEHPGGRADPTAKVETSLWISVDIDRSSSIDGRSRTTLAATWYNKASHPELHTMCTQTTVVSDILVSGSWVRHNPRKMQWAHLGTHLALGAAFPWIVGLNSDPLRHAWHVLL